LVVLTAQKPKQVDSAFVIDGEEDDIGRRREDFRDRPLGFDCAAYPAQVLHEFDAFIVGLMDHLHTQTTKIPQDADSQYILRSGVDLLRVIR
jgi:hypothetical protein